MQAPARAFRATIFRQAPRTQSSPQQPPFAATPASLHSFGTAPYASNSSSSSSAPWTPSLRFPTSHVRGLATSGPTAAQHAQDLFETAPLFERVQQSPEVLAAIQSAFAGCRRCSPLRVRARVEER